MSPIQMSIVQVQTIVFLEYIAKTTPSNLVYLTVLFKLLSHKQIKRASIMSIKNVFGI